MEFHLYDRIQLCDVIHLWPSIGTTDDVLCLEQCFWNFIVCIWLNGFLLVSYTSSSDPEIRIIHFSFLWKVKIIKKKLVTFWFFHFISTLEIVLLSLTLRLVEDDLKAKWCLENGTDPGSNRECVAQSELSNFSLLESNRFQNCCLLGCLFVFLPVWFIWLFVFF